MTTTTHFETRGTGQQEILMESGRGLPSVMGDFTAKPGLVRGHITWTMDCRRVVVNQQVTDEIKTERPNRRAGVGLLALGAGLGALGVGAVSSADQYSNEQTCSTDINGNYSCSSPQQDMIALGAIGVVTGAVMAATGLVTVAAKPRTSIISTATAPPTIARVTQEHTVCGSEPISDLGLSLVQNNQWVASSSTNEEGDVAFAVPPMLKGEFVVVVDAVPPPLAHISVGDVVGSVEITSSSPGDFERSTGLHRER